MTEVSKGEDILIVINSQLKKLNLKIDLTKKPTKVGGELFWESEVYSISEKPDDPKAIAALFGYQLPITPARTPNDRDAAALTAEFQKRLGAKIGQEAHAYFFEKTSGEEGNGYILKVREDLIHHVNLKKNEAHVRSILGVIQDLNLSNAEGEAATLESASLTVDEFVDRLTTDKDKTKQLYLIGGSGVSKLDPNTLRSKDIELSDQERGCDDLLKNFLRGQEITLNHRAYRVLIEEGVDGVRKIKILVALTDITPPAPIEEMKEAERWEVTPWANYKIRGIMPPPPPPRPQTPPEQTTTTRQPQPIKPAPRPTPLVEIQRTRPAPERQKVASIKTIPTNKTKVVAKKSKQKAVTDHTRSPSMTQASTTEIRTKPKKPVSKAQTTISKPKRVTDATSKPKRIVPKSEPTVKKPKEGMGVFRQPIPKPVKVRPKTTAKFNPQELHHRERHTEPLRERNKPEDTSRTVERPKEHPQAGDKGKGKGKK